MLSIYSNVMEVLAIVDINVTGFLIFEFKIHCFIISENDIWIYLIKSIKSLFIHYMYIWCTWCVTWCNNVWCNGVWFIVLAPAQGAPHFVVVVTEEQIKVLNLHLFTSHSTQSPADCNVALHEDKEEGEDHWLCKPKNQEGIHYQS